MPASNLSRYLLQIIVVGVAAAVVVVMFFPETIEQPRPVVEVRESSAGDGLQRDSGPVSYAHAVANAAPSVVNIYTRKTVREQGHPLLDDPMLRRFFGDRLGGARERTQTSLGSGVIISPEGYILTSQHVVKDADAIQVLLPDERSARARSVGEDPETDVAVLKIELEDLPSVTVESEASPRVGDVVLAIGNPFGVGQTVTQGIVSATGRDELGINTFEDFIQTDAAINPGNSGGALINARGHLIGINTAIFSRSGGSQGIGFAIPINLAREVMTEIIEEGQVSRGWLGVEAQEITPELAQSFGLETQDGVLIAGVVRGGPAQAAGIQPGDVITHLGGQRVTDARSALNIIARHDPGETLEIRGIRAGQRFSTEARVAGRPQSQG